MNEIVVIKRPVKRDSSLQVDTPSKPRIQRHLELLQLVTQLTQRVLQLGHVGVDLRRGRLKHGLRVCEG